jgi:hypothetical protein
MDCFVYYTFRGKVCAARAFFSFEQEPYFIFLWLFDSALINEFGDEISIKTDLEKVLSRKNDYKGLMELEEAIFAALKKEPAFIAERVRKLSYSTQY